jgi:hypothetical protein
MSIFNKDSSAKDKVKELTGGFSLNQSFKNKLESNDLDISYGPKIQMFLKQDVNNGLPANQVENRLNYYIEQAVLTKNENLDIAKDDFTDNEKFSIKQMRKELDDLTYQNQIIIKQNDLLKKQNDEILKKLNKD